MLRTLVLVLLLVMVPTVPTGPAQTVAATGADPQWEWPVGAPTRVVRVFLAPATPYAAGHRGIDLAVGGTPSGDPVFAPADGIVHFAGIVFDRPVLSIQHPGGLLSSYEPVTTTLHRGELVERGQVVGTVVAGTGAAGHCSLPCLHFGVRLHGEYLSPSNFLGGIARSVLLPTRRGSSH